ncbi:hypothetical protein H6G36_14080 [Anabaena minutissima FACHB-250]|nr:hypothetical protein [Anabaena minutissima FACHB-250]
MKTLEIIVTITTDGKLLINASVDLPVGEYNAVLVLEDQPISSSIQTSVQEAQAVLRKYIPASRELSEELIEERRLESLSE